MLNNLDTPPEYEDWIEEAFQSRPAGVAALAAILINHPRSPYTSKGILDRATEILEAHCTGLGDVYTIGLSINMTGDDLSRTMIEWIESHAVVAIAVGAEMAP